MEKPVFFIFLIFVLWFRSGGFIYIVYIGGKK